MIRQLQHGSLQHLAARPADYRWRGACPGQAGKPRVALPRPLFHDGQIDELRRTREHVGHHRLTGLQPFLAARIPLTRTRLLLALEHDQGVQLIRVLLVPPA
jgi:hypothetical protein